MRKIALAAMLMLVLFLAGCTGLAAYKERAAKTGTIMVKTMPSGLDLTIDRAGVTVAEGVSPFTFDGAEVNKNYLITATNAEGLQLSETRSITKTGGSVTVTLNFNEMRLEAQ